MAFTLLVLVAKLGHDPQAELLPLDGPLLEPPRLEAAPDGGLADVAAPLVGGLVLEGGPADAVLGERAQAGQSQVVPALEGLPEVVGGAGRVLAEHGRVVVAEGAGDAAGQQRRQRVAHDGAAEPQHLVADGAALDQDALVLDQVDQQGMLVQAEAVPDAPRAQQDRVVQVVVRLAARAQALARVEEEGDADALLGALLAEPEQLRQHVLERPAQVLLADQVVARDQVRVRDLGRHAVVHALDNIAQVVDADRRPDQPDAPEPLALGRRLERPDLVVDGVHHGDVVLLGRLAALQKVVEPPREAQLGVADAVLGELAHQPAQEGPEDGLVVDDGLDDAEAVEELLPDLVDAVVLGHGVGARQ